MNLPLRGGCQCGQLRYEIRGEPMSVYNCHCTECQRQSGSAFGMSMIVPRAALVYVAGAPAKWSRISERGNVLEGDLCSTCGVRIAHLPRVNEKVAILKPGTLDYTSWLVPVGHIWTRSAQPWVTFEEGSVIFEGHPDIGALIEAWQRRTGAAL
jgi:hypothetical protein